MNEGVVVKDGLKRGLCIPRVNLVLDLKDKFWVLFDENVTISCLTRASDRTRVYLKTVVSKNIDKRLATRVFVHEEVAHLFSQRLGDCVVFGLGRYRLGIVNESAKDRVKQRQRDGRFSFRRAITAKEDPVIFLQLFKFLWAGLLRRCFGFPFRNNSLPNPPQCGG